MKYSPFSDIPGGRLALGKLAPLGQVLALIAGWCAVDRLTRAAGWPVPGSVVGFFVLLALLGSGVLPAPWVRRGAYPLLDHLMLFFVPAMLGLIDHPELLGPLGGKLLVAVLVGTPVVMLATAAVVEVGFRWTARHDR